MELEQRVERLEAKVAEMESTVRDLSEVVKAIKHDTEELIALIKGTRMLAGVIKWSAGLVAACGVIWTTLRSAGKL